MILIALLSANQLSGQDKLGLILTKEENYRWIEKLKKLDFDEQILELKERVLLDTNSVLNECCVDGLIWTKPDDKELCKCKPVIIVDNKSFYSANDVKVSEITEFALMLLPIKFKDIRIYTDKNKDAYAVFGLASECGIIVLDARNKRIKRKFEKLELY